MTQRLQSLRVSGFRQLADVSLPSVGAVNLLVGANNSGKSSLLEALRIFAARGAPAMLERLLVSHGELSASSTERAGGTSPERAVSNLFTGRYFPDQDGDVIYVGEADRSSFVTLEHVYLREFLEERELAGEVSSVRRLKLVPKASVGTAEDLIEAVEITVAGGAGQLLDDVKRVIRVPLQDIVGKRRTLARSRFEESVSSIPCRYVSPRVPSSDFLAESWDEIVLTDAEEVALSALRIIEPKTLSLAFIQSGSSGNSRAPMMKVAGLAGPVPLQSMGDGMSRVLELALGALGARDGILLVDEIENGLHFKAQHQVWKLLFNIAERTGLQIFAATHSSDCVAAFSSVSLDSDLSGSLIRVERQDEGDGRSFVSAVSEDALDDLVQAEIEVR
jgi:hypothetical protein